MTNSISKEIMERGYNIIEDNNFLFDAFENRLIIRLTHIFDKYKIPMNKSIIKKNMEENLINSLKDSNEEIIEKYIKMLERYEKIIYDYVSAKTETSVIKKSTLSFVNKISKTNKTFVTIDCGNNFIEYINSIIYVYDNKKLNDDIIGRINIDIKEILGEFNRNNYNYVIGSINDIIKNIIKNM